MRFNFVGGSYPIPILRADAQSSINLYQETDKSGAGKSKAQLVGTPGLQKYLTLPNSPVRGIWITGNANGLDTMYVAGGSRLYQMFDTATQTDRGDIGNDGRLVQIFPNRTGTQIGIVSGGQFYVAVTSPAGNAAPASYASGGGPVYASCGTTMDGYAIVAVPNSNKFQISDVNSDFTVWHAADWGVKEGYSDFIQAIITDSINLYLIGAQTMEIFRDTGNADFPFERIPGELLNIGIAAPQSVDRLGNGIIFLAKEPRGGPIAITFQGYQWTRVSNAALEAIWAKYLSVYNAVGFTYIDAGHSFWQISFPSANATWCYDATEDSWHQRGYWNGTSNDRSKVWVHGYGFWGHYAGDYASGNVYKMSRDFYTDDNQPIQRQRTASHIADENKRFAYSQFTLDVQAGEIATPAFTLDWSNDGGNTFKKAYTQSIGAVGDFFARFNWRRLGQARVRTFRVTSFAPMRHRWIDGYFEGSPSND